MEERVVGGGLWPAQRSEQERSDFSPEGSGPKDKNAARARHPAEWNTLFHPLHPNIGELQIGPPQPFVCDVRMFKQTQA
jgi:hypothetical protein